MSKKDACNFCFEPLNPHDTNPEKQSFVRCESCNFIYHQHCWDDKQCVECGGVQAIPIDVEAPKPAQFFEREGFVSVFGNRIRYTPDARLFLYLQRLLILAFVGIVLIVGAVVGYFGWRYWRVFSHYNTANRYLESGQWAQARQEFELVLDMNRNFRDASTLLLETYYRPASQAMEAGNFSAAANGFIELLRVNPDYKDARGQLAESYYQLALSALELSDFSKCRDYLGLLEAEVLDYKDASTLLRESYYRPAVNAIQDKEWEVARQHLSNLMTIDSNYKDSADLYKQSYYEPALQSFRAKRWEESRQLLELLLRVDPKYKDSATLVRETYYLPAQAAFQAERWQECQSLLEQLASFDAQYKDAASLLLESYYLPGYNAMQGGRWEEADTHLSRLVALDETYKDARNLLLETYYKAGKEAYDSSTWTQARHWFDKLCALDCSYADTQTFVRALGFEQFELTFASDRDGSFEIYLLDLDDPTNWVKLPRPEGYQRAFWPWFCEESVIAEMGTNSQSETNQWLYWLDPIKETAEKVIPLPGAQGIRATGVPRCTVDGGILAYNARSGPWILKIVDLRDSKTWEVRLGAGKYVENASFSKNGSRLVYFTHDQDTKKYEIWFQTGFDDPNPQNITPANLPSGEEISSALYPAISPDGRQVAFVAETRDKNNRRNYHLCLLRLGSSQVTILVAGLGSSRDYPLGTPVWSSDGVWIYYTAINGGTWDIFRVRSDGSGRALLTGDWKSNEIMPAIRDER